MGVTLCARVASPRVTGGKVNTRECCIIGGVNGSTRLLTAICTGRKRHKVMEGEVQAYGAHLTGTTSVIIGPSRIKIVIVVE